MTLHSPDPAPAPLTTSVPTPANAADATAVAVGAGRHGASLGGPRGFVPLLGLATLGICIAVITPVLAR